jgi:hypothetical protein
MEQNNDIKAPKNKRARETMGFHAGWGAIQNGQIDRYEVCAFPYPRLPF